MEMKHGIINEYFILKYIPEKIIIYFLIFKHYFN